MNKTTETRYLRYAALIYRGVPGVKAAEELGYKGAAKASERMSRSVVVCREIDRLKALEDEKLGERAVENAQDLSL